MHALAFPGSSSPPQEEYDDLQMMDSIRVANRDIDPAFFQNPQSREDQDEVGEFLNMI